MVLVIYAQMCRTRWNLRVAQHSSSVALSDVTHTKNDRYHRILQSLLGTVEIRFISFVESNYTVATGNMQFVFDEPLLLWLVMFFTLHILIQFCLEWFWSLHTSLFQQERVTLPYRLPNKALTLFGRVWVSQRTENVEKVTFLCCWLLTKNSFSFNDFRLVLALEAVLMCARLDSFYY